MANKKPTDVVPEQQASTDFPITLQEFCTRISVNDKRVELIGAFYTTMLAAGNISATQTEFADKLEQFAKQPA